jgi:hypothetical protein
MYSSNSREIPTVPQRYAPNNGTDDCTGHPNNYDDTRIE